LISDINFRKRNETSNATKKGFYKLTQFLRREGWEIEYSFTLERTNLNKISSSSTLDNQIHKFLLSIT
jgi:hypothetical protein